MALSGSRRWAVGVRRLALGVGANVGDRRGETFELWLVKLGEDALDEVVAQQLLIADDLESGRGQPHDDDAAVFAVTNSLHESAFLEPVDEAGRVRVRDVQQLREAAHREIPVVVEQGQHVHMRHADALLHHPLRSDTLQFAQARLQVGNDALNEGLRRLPSLRCDRHIVCSTRIVLFTRSILRI